MRDHPQLLSAIHLAARKLASSGHFDDLLKDVLAICVEAVGANGGTVYLHDQSRRTLQFRHVLPDAVASTLQFTDIPDDYGVAGQAFQTRKPIISSFSEENKEHEEIDRKAGVRVSTMITVPLMMENEQPIGVVQLVNKRVGTFDESDATVLDTVSAISTMAYLNSKLLEESTRASQLLGMGKVSHDIKNLAFALEANLSFSDETVRSLREELDKIDAGPHVKGYVDGIEIMLEELSVSIDRIKRYSTLMSDLSAGKQLQPQMKLAPLAHTIQLSAAYLESEGRSKCVRICYEIQQDAPSLLHDEMYLFRIVQNLVSNAIKAVAEAGEPANLDEDEQDSWKQVIVRYKYDRDEHIVEVEDHGPGMSPQTAESILNGNAISFWNKSSGSGWGTKIVLELAATHNAKVSIDSSPGKGTIFRVIFPATLT